MLTFQVSTQVRGTFWSALHL